jgi:hypothetical protein
LPAPLEGLAAEAAHTAATSSISIRAARACKTVAAAYLAVTILNAIGAFFIVPTIAFLTRILFGRLDPAPEPKLISSLS